MNLVYCLLYLAAIGILSFILGRLLPKSWFRAERFPYAPWKFEKNGAIYEKLGVRKWQNRVPDMSKILPKWIPPKKITRNYGDRMPEMIRETCVAELIHELLCVCGLACLWIWPGIGGVLVTVLYILGNLPDIIIQRYNRPRLLHLQERLKRKKSD